jgi:hypothetical protein
MRPRLAGCRSGTMCACAVLVRDGADPCAKCVRRARWLRRKARRSFEQTSR